MKGCDMKNIQYLSWIKWIFSLNLSVVFLNFTWSIDVVESNWAEIEDGSETNRDRDEFEIEKKMESGVLLSCNWDGLGFDMYKRMDQSGWVCAVDVIERDWSC